MKEAQDVNGDGFPDILIGAPIASHGGRRIAGASYVIFGRAANAVVADIDLLPLNTAATSTGYAVSSY